MKENSPARAQEKQLQDVVKRVELLEASQMFRQGWLKGADERFGSLEAGHDGLSVTLSATIAQGESWKTEVERKLQQIQEEQLRLSTRLQDSHERWEGQKTRIDRILGTCDDLLKRFEAWKTVGNEMGETVNNHQAVLQAHTELFKSLNERLELHRAMLDALAALGKDVGQFMREIQRILAIDPPLVPAEPPGDGSVPPTVAP
jgi:chromosome segregation ATPase